MTYLHKKGILPLGTAHLKRLTVPTKKEGKGAMCEKTTKIDDVKISAVSWFHNQIVTLVSTYVRSQPIVENSSSDH
jgi:hypothetical protein